MSDVTGFLWLIPALPLVASVLTAALGPRLLRQHSHWPCILAAAGAAVLSFVVLFAVQGPAGEVRAYYTWFQAGRVDVAFSLRADGLSAIMLVTVTFVSTFIAIYSAGYMRGDPGYPRFFAEMALFIFSMTGLVLADNFLLLYAFWEGVGLCSYLLVGFWFNKPSAADAARKAFLVTRLGDLGFLLGIILLWITAGHTLNYDDIFDPKKVLSFEHGTLTVICLLLLCGAVGKSAQFPLHVWLPDAMEGPTPVSALIHAATMVTAGVYLVARCTPLFAHAPEARVVVAVIGGSTALLAALIALTQNDLKRVLAYSTISQLGYMFLALGSGAVVAAIFHLFTHAFFKALLFLAAGSVMHAMGGVIDMRRFGGLKRLMPVTHVTFLCGAAALAGVPLLSGFWSKDEILAGAYDAGTEGATAPAVYLLLLAVGLVTAGLTAFYTFRGYYLTFWGEERIPHEAGEHAHESPRVMTVPLVVLAVGAVGAGIVVEPFTHWFSRGLDTRTLGLEHHEHGVNYVVMGLSTLLALGGIGVARWFYVSQPGLAGKLAAAVPGLYQLSVNKFYLDELYAAFVVKPLEGFSEFCRVVDLYLIDGLVDFIAQVPRLIGYVFFRPLQNGLVQSYALLIGLYLAVLLCWLAFW